MALFPHIVCLSGLGSRDEADSDIVYGHIGGVDWTWYVLGNLFALGATCPFVGSLSDLFGRRYVAIGGASLLIIGNIISATANTMNVFIGGMVIMGVGECLMNQ